jgi:hypothetical protein
VCLTMIVLSQLGRSITFTIFTSLDNHVDRVNHFNAACHAPLRINPSFQPCVSDLHNSSIFTIFEVVNSEPCTSSLP